MIFPPTADNIDRAARLIREGELVAFPTETVYGLGANALDAAAVEKIYRVKGRPPTNPIIVHIADVRQIHAVADPASNPELISTLKKLEEFWPGPLSLVLPKRPAVPNVVTAGLRSVAVRIPAHPVALKLLKAAGVPIAAPSANTSNYVSPTTAGHVEETLGPKIAMIIDGGPCKVGLESTVLSLVTNPPTILRPGAVTEDDLREVLGEVAYRADQTVKDAAPSPGLHPLHYAPRTPVRFLHEVQCGDLPRNCGLIAFSSAAALDQGDRFAVVESLSGAADLEEVAANLFGALRKLDNLNLGLIVVDSCLEAGLGAAIMDRLRRAARR